MTFSAKKKDPAAVSLGRKGGVKGGAARAANMTPEERSASARGAVQARWEKHKKLGDDTTASDPTTKTPIPVRSAAELDTSKKALHACLQRIKEAESESEVRRLTELPVRVKARVPKTFLTPDMAPRGTEVH